VPPKKFSSATPLVTLENFGVALETQTVALEKFVVALQMLPVALEKSVLALQMALENRIWH